MEFLPARLSAGNATRRSPIAPPWLALCSSARKLGSETGDAAAIASDLIDFGARVDVSGADGETLAECLSQWLDSGPSPRLDAELALSLLERGAPLCSDSSRLAEATELWDRWMAKLAPSAHASWRARIEALRIGFGVMARGGPTPGPLRL
jgi:hypothetical protein